MLCEEESTIMTRTALAIRHVPFEDLGSFAPVLQANGYAVRYVEAGLDDIGTLDPLAADLVIVLGGPIGVNDGADYPFLEDELRLIGCRLAADRPLLGICLGAQLIACALGAPAYRAARPEIGWAPLILTEAGQRSCLAPLAAGEGEETVPVLHWHGDTFDLPTGAVRLASTEVCPNQAFAVGRTGLGLQFHVEAEGRALERWFIGHACEIAATAGVTVGRLRAETARHAAALEARSGAVLRRWLRGIAAGGPEGSTLPAQSSS